MKVIWGLKELEILVNLYSVCFVEALRATMCTTTKKHTPYDIFYSKTRIMNQTNRAPDMDLD